MAGYEIVRNGDNPGEFDALSLYDDALEPATSYTGEVSATINVRTDQGTGPVTPDPVEPTDPGESTEVAIDRAGRRSAKTKVLSDPDNAQLILNRDNHAAVIATVFDVFIGVGYRQEISGSSGTDGGSAGSGTDI